jgi:hypothetical protein
LPQSTDAAAMVSAAGIKDEIGPQSVQEAAGIKQNSYASATRTSKYS